MNYHLTDAQKTAYDKNGYLNGLPPIYSPEEMRKLNADLPQLLALLEEGETAKDIREWHETSTYLYDIVMNPRIHDLVEGILGPNFFAWASSFFLSAEERSRVLATSPLRPVLEPPNPRPSNASTTSLIVW